MASSTYAYVWRLQQPAASDWHHNAPDNMWLTIALLTSDGLKTCQLPTWCWQHVTDNCLTDIRKVEDMSATNVMLTTCVWRLLDWHQKGWRHVSYKRDADNMWLTNEDMLTDNRSLPQHIEVWPLSVSLMSCSAFNTCNKYKQFSLVMEASI